MNKDTLVKILSVISLAGDLADEALKTLDNKSKDRRKLPKRK